MSEPPSPTYLEPGTDAARAFFGVADAGGVVMLNLLRFRAVADYAAAPQLAPGSEISGKEAYRRYMEHTVPYLQAAGGQVIFFGCGGAWLIGPTQERWDAALLVRQRSRSAFLGFASDPGYLAGMGHRMAALEDSRLLPLTDEVS